MSETIEFGFCHDATGRYAWMRFADHFSGHLPPWTQTRQPVDFVRGVFYVRRVDANGEPDGDLQAYGTSEEFHERFTVEQ